MIKTPRSISSKISICSILIIIAYSGQLLSATNKKNVLFISSYNSSFPTFFKQIEGLKSVFDTMDVNLDVEFMDAKRLTNADNDILFKDYLSFKMANVPVYDAIISSDDHAFNFILKNQDSLFKHVPLVFCGVNNVDAALSQNKNSRMTGIIESVSIEETIDLMLELFPQSNKLYAIVDGTPSGQGDLKTYYKLSEKHPTISFQDISLVNLSFGEFATQLSKVETNTPVLLLLSAYHDKTMLTYDFEKSLSHIKKHLRAPLFHLWYHGMGNGIFGGKLISHHEQAKAAALKVCDIFSGHEVSSLNISAESPNRYYFDSNELERFNIDKSMLPLDSMIMNLPQTFYAKNKQLIFVTIFIIATLLIFIAGLSVNNLERRKIAKDLRKKNKEIAIQNDEIASQYEEFLTMNEELNQTNQELILAKEKAEESDALKTEFINNISHEIRTPMNGILGFIDIIMQYELPTDERNTYLNYILNNGQRLMQIIEDIIELSRLGTKQVKVLYEEICLNEFLKEISLIFTAPAQEKNITLRLNNEVQNNESYVVVDSHKLSKIMNILLNNAIKFTEVGFIELGYKKDSDLLELYVKDSGIGIDESKHELIFERFQQAEKEVSQKADGIGLGLSIAKEISNLLGGDILLESQINKGAKFTVKIPLSGAEFIEIKEETKPTVNI